MKRLVFALVSVFFVLATILTVSYAWFINSDLEDPDVSGYSYAAYFASGNGSQEDPYTITNKRHLYNLAWLQYLGKWNEFTTSTVDGKEVKTLTNQYYFQISPTVKELDMSNYPLPPIGTEENPFIGVFNGNGCIIKNLTVSNDISEFGTNLPKADEVNKTNIEELNIIGMFGVVGNYNSMYNISSYVPSIQNFYIDDVTISSISNKTLIGLLAGYVGPSGNITNIGIHYSRFKLSNAVNHLGENEFLSKFSLIGDYDSENIGWEDKPSAGGSGAGDTWGASIDFKQIYERMDLISNATDRVNYDYGIYNFGGVPSKIGSGSFYFEGKSYVPLKISNEMTQSRYNSGNLNGEKIEDIASNNPGYITGAKNGDTGTDSTVRFSAKSLKTALNKDTTSYTVDDTGKITDLTFYTKRDSNSSTSSLELAENYYASGKAYYSGKYPKVKQAVIDLLNDSGGLDGAVYGMRFQGNKVDQNDKVTITNAVVNGVTYDTYDVYARGLSFSCKEDGYVCVVGLNWEQEWGNLFNIYKVNRSSDYKSITSLETLTAYYDFDDTTKTTPMFDAQWGQIPQYKLIYYEIPLEGGYEYALNTHNNSGGCYLIYLDIGISGGGSDDGNTQDPTYSGNLSSIDFVYSTGTGLSVVSDETKSNVLLTVAVVTVTENSIYFKRKVDEELDAVLYCITSSGYTVTNIGSGTATSTTDTNCDSVSTS